jgi:hypothetical protein
MLLEEQYTSNYILLIFMVYHSRCGPTFRPRVSRLFVSIPSMTSFSKSSASFRVSSFFSTVIRRVATTAVTGPDCCVERYRDCSIYVRYSERGACGSQGAEMNRITSMVHASVSVSLSPCLCLSVSVSLCLWYTFSLNSYANHANVCVHTHTTGKAET